MWGKVGADLLCTGQGGVGEAEQAGQQGLYARGGLGLVGVEQICDTGTT